MSSKKKESEGIALLSMYNDEEDEDDEMEDVNEENQPNDREEVEEEDLISSNGSVKLTTTTTTTTTTTSFFYQSETYVPMEDSATPPKEDRVRTPSPQHQIPSSLPQQSTQMPPLFPPPPTLQRQKRSLGIVDYAHDEAAMSPEAEEGEITGSVNVTFGEDLQNADGNFQGTSPSGAVQILTPNIQGTPQSLEHPDILQSDNNTTGNRVTMEFETTVVEETVTISVDEEKDVDPLDNFLPPPPRTLCSEELQEKINKFLKLKSAGKSFNAEVRNRKDYRNPDFLLYAVRYQDIDQIGSCFSKDVFDPHGYDKSDFYDELEADMKRELERKEQERKKSQKLDFVVGGIQAGIVAAGHRNVTQNPQLISAVPTPISHPAPADTLARESRQNKKSKWDQGDSDRINSSQAGGSDALANAAAHAALLSATNAGAGYTAFAQQKRREAEERRSSSDRRRS